MLLNSVLWLTQIPILRLDPRYAMMLATAAGALTSSVLVAWQRRRLAKLEKLEARRRTLDESREAQRREERRAHVRGLVERRLLSAYEHTSRSHLSGPDEGERAP